ncbi:MAG TPA: aspartate-semialdehyde dehydrogenase [Candidatus Eremiobacteraceae bacterium]|nr:aspartate-semialdehyde dehydrogenase [Candidatus Eremiobacteraceae bacterium]
MSAYRVAIVGATGVVGETVARILEERRFPISSLRAFATQRSAGSVVRSGSSEAVVEAIDASAPDPGLFDGVDVAFFAAGDAVSAAYGRLLAERGVLVVDKSSAYRLEPDVPLVVPEVNGAAISGHRLIANPNCSTIPLAMALAPIERAFGLKWVSVSTYQSVSGAGRDAVDELGAQTRGEDRAAAALPKRIAGNVIPEVGSFEAGGDCGEESKIAAEFRKIISQVDLPVSATTVRVPVAVGHSEAVAFATKKPASREQIREVLAMAPGVTFTDGTAYATPLDVAGTDIVAVGRLRPDRAHDDAWLIWIVCDNLRKGAATNAVQIAESALRSAPIAV